MALRLSESFGCRRVIVGDYVCCARYFLLYSNGISTTYYYDGHGNGWTVCITGTGDGGKGGWAFMVVLYLLLRMMIYTCIETHEIVWEKGFFSHRDSL